MTRREMHALKAEASACFQQGEEAMLVTPLALIDLMDRIERLERQIVETGDYDVLHSASIE